MKDRDELILAIMIVGMAFHIGYLSIQVNRLKREVVDTFSSNVECLMMRGSK